MIFINKYFSELFDSFITQWKSFSFGFNDILDILIVSVVLYYIYKFIRDRRAGKLAVGVILIILMSLLSKLFSLHAMSYLIDTFFQIGLLALVVLFQPELRSVLEKAGGNSIKSLKILGETRDIEATQKMIDNVCDAACEMAKDKTGALIVFENETRLGDIIASGTVVNADVSSFLIRNIFFENTPLHDGAVVVRDNRVYAAGCFLPLSANDALARELGTRHRAAVGISEVSDALVLVVSEETGVISVCFDGKIERNFDYTKLRNRLAEFLIHQPDNKNSKKGFNLKSRKKQSDTVKEDRKK